MKHPPRIYCPELGRVSGDPIEIAGEPFHHLCHVLRKKVDDAVVLFDGRGAEATGRIEQITRHTAAIGELDVKSRPPPAGPKITLACAVLRGQRQIWLVEKASELGVDRLIPVLFERSVARPRDGGAKVDRWRQTAIAAAQQCGRNRIMDIELPVPFRELTQRFSDFCLVVVGTVPSDQPPAAKGPLPGAGEVLIVVGPEGDLSQAERRLLTDASQAASVPLSRIALGRYILRTETAALALIARLAPLTAESRRAPGP